MGRWEGTLAGLAMLVVVAAGCGGGVDLPNRAKVSGRVTLDGQPVTRGTVVFTPDNTRGTTGPPAYGQIGPDGKYELTTDRSGRGGDGAVVGFHKVAVQAREDVMPGEIARLLVPTRYEDPDRSGLTGEVKAGQPNEINLELRSK